MYMKKLWIFLVFVFLIILINFNYNSDAIDFQIIKKSDINKIQEPVYPSGTVIRGKSFGSQTAVDYALACAIDGEGDVYTAGKINNKPAVVKTDKYGNVFWTYIATGAGGGEVRSIAIDKIGYVYITGNFISTQDFGGGPLVTAGGYDVFVVKLDPWKRHIWSKRYGSPAFSSTPTETGNAIAIDPTDNSVVFTALWGDGGAVDFGGGFVTPSYIQDAIIVKLTTDGNFVWNRHIGGSAGTYPAGLTVDKVGSVYVTGAIYSPTKFDNNIIVTNNAGINNDAFVAKYSANNVFQWVKNYGQQTVQATGQNLLVDNNGDLIFLGLSMGLNNFGGIMLTNRGADDIILAKYNSYNGNHIWSKSIGSWAMDYAKGIGIDSSNRITIAGIFNRSLNFNDGNFLPSSNPSVDWQAFVASFESNGSLVWARSFGNGAARLEGVAVRPDGRIFTVGRMTGLENFGSFVLSNYQDILFLEFAK